MRSPSLLDRNRLSDHELYELSDMLAIQLHGWLGHRVYKLSRNDIAELIESFVDDLHPRDQRDVAWVIWHLFQDAMEMHMKVDD
jgi:hypothetical protein